MTAMLLCNPAPLNWVLKFMPPRGEGWETERQLGGRVVGGIAAEVHLDPNPVEQQLLEDRDGKFQGCGSNWTGGRN